MVPLFDSGERSDPTPASHAESRFRFLNRVNRPYFAKVRDTLQEWFDRYPQDDSADLRSRLRSDDDRQMSGAFWELYLHESFLRLNWTVTVHPAVVGTANRPDFLVERADESAYVEATMAGTSDENTAADNRRGRVYDSLNRLDSPNFFLWLDVESEGQDAPPAGKFRPALESWLAGLDPDEVTRTLPEPHDVRNLPSKSWERDGWVITFRAIPKKAESRGKPGVRPVGVFGPGKAQVISPEAPIRAALRDKASKYGRLDRPYIIAVLAEDLFADESSVERALYGSEAYDFTAERAIRNLDGFWTRPEPGAHAGVSAVLSAIHLAPWNVPRTEPILWLNPWAESPIKLSLPWRKNRLDLAERRMVSAEGAVEMPALFGLPKDWPGPEEPFEKNA